MIETELKEESPQPPGRGDVWILVQHREGVIEEATFGLIGEARRIASEMGGEITVTAVCFGSGLGPELEKLGPYGADTVLYMEDESLSRYHGEIFALELSRLAARHSPSLILAVQTHETADLCARVAALLETALVTCAMDLEVDRSGEFQVVRPVSNGYLFERIRVVSGSPAIVSLLPSVLAPPMPEMEKRTRVLAVEPEIRADDLTTRVIEIIKADPGDLDIEDADIVVAGGRGVGRHAFGIIHELARAIGGSVGATRPVIDWQALPHERQIGQTGKTVNPRLIINCGISGANEYTAGMEKSKLIIAINTDPRARIFRFADLKVVGNLHEVIPLLVERLKENKDSTD